MFFLARASGGMADAHGSGPCVREDVGVQLPPCPPFPGEYPRGARQRPAAPPPGRGCRSSPSRAGAAAQRSAPPTRAPTRCRPSPVSGVMGVLPPPTSWRPSCTSPTAPQACTRWRNPARSDRADRRPEPGQPRQGAVRAGLDAGRLPRRCSRERPHHRPGRPRQRGVGRGHRDRRRPGARRAHRGPTRRRGLPLPLVQGCRDAPHPACETYPQGVQLVRIPSGGTGPCSRKPPGAPSCQPQRQTGRSLRPLPRRDAGSDGPCS